MKKLIVLILALLLCTSAVACKSEEPQDQASDNVQVMSVATALSGDSIYDYEANTITKTVTATVLPETAFNKKVDFSLAWEDGAEQSSEDVNEYVELLQNEDGGNVCSVVCKKPFTSKMILTCKTRANNLKSTCEVSYLGFATTFTATLRDYEKAEGTDIYVLPRDFSATIDLFVDSFFHSPTVKFTWDLKAYGEAWFFNESTNSYKIVDLSSISLDDARDKDEPSYNNGVFDVFYLSSNKDTLYTYRHGASTTIYSSLRDLCLPDYAEYGYMIFADNLDNDNAIKNHEVYFELTITEKISGLTQIIKYNVWDNAESVELTGSISF